MTPELSIIMPCLNEARTLPTCIRKAQAFLARAKITGEVVVADNGSTDASRDIACRMGARLVDVPARGYGHALIEAIKAAKGTYVIMGDADDSYDFSDLSDFVARLRDGDDLVMGNRFRGGIDKGAMPALHRYLGNPLLSFLGRLLYRAPVGDFHCGLRGFNRQQIIALALNCGGMEFASEMVVKAALNDYRISEIPIRLHVDGRDRPPHLNSWQDGWRHLRFLLIFSPRWLFVLPGLILMGLGLLGMLALLPGPLTIGTVTFDIHSLLYCAGSIVLGTQMFYMGCMAAAMGFAFNVLPPGRTSRLAGRITLERGLLIGGLALLAGFALSLKTVIDWEHTGFSHLNPVQTMRSTIPAVALMIVGVQTMITSLLLSAFDIYREQHEVRRDLA